MQDDFHDRVVICRVSLWPVERRITRLVHGNGIPVGFPWETSHGMGWDRHKLLWDGNGTDKYVPWTTLRITTTNSHNDCVIKIVLGDRYGAVYVVVKTTKLKNERKNWLFFGLDATSFQSFCGLKQDNILMLLVQRGKIIYLPA